MEIPYRQLSPEALEALIEEIVTRDGTDYGAAEMPLARKKKQVREQLRAGRAVITYDPETRTCNILPKEGG